MEYSIWGKARIRELTGFTIFDLPFTIPIFNMTIDALIMLIGAFVILEPHLGFPTTWDSALLFIAGAVIVGLGIAVRRRGLREPRTQETNSGHTQ
jgi:hypothetical protein